MQIAEFTLERYFARWEFAVRHVLCASDVEPFTLPELIDLADDHTRSLWSELRLGYTETLGHPLLREEIARTYHDVDADHVITFAGAEEGIFLAMHALLDPGDHAVVAWPAYQSLYEVARSIGAETTLVPLEPRDWSLDPDRVAAAIRPNTRVVVVNFPHSPTGSLLDRSAFDHVLRIAADAGAYLLSDEVYRGLELEPGAQLPAAADRGDRTMSLGVMSKAYALAGLRVGWIATKDTTLLQRLARLRDYTTICNSAPSEVLALIALRARDRVLARSLAILRENLSLLDGFFERQRDRVAWVRPRAGSVAFPRFLTADADRVARDLIAAEGVLLMPGSAFKYPGDHFRIGFGRRDLASGLARFEAYLAGGHAD